MDVKQKVGQLKQLRYLKGEVILLSRRIERLEAEIGNTCRARWRGGQRRSTGRGSSTCAGSWRDGGPVAWRSWKRCMGL